MQIIDPLSGNIHLLNGRVVAADMEATALVGLFSKDDLNFRDMKNEWTHYLLENQLIDGKYFGFTFIFLKKTLKFITIYFAHSSAVDNSWHAWNLEEELNKKAMFEDWLNTQLGSTRVFNWGSVSAGYDAKGGFSSISVIYN